MKKGYIYKITNDINDLIYIGQTIRDIQTRFHEHCFDNHSKSYLHNAINKYGYLHFKVEEIECVDIALLDDREKYWIAYYDSTNRDKGYNILPGGKLYEYRDYPQIMIVENKLIANSKDALADLVSIGTGWKHEYLRHRFSECIENNNEFCGYHLIEINAESYELSEDDSIIDWARKLNKIYVGKHIYCQELNMEFDTISNCARYLIQNGYYITDSKAPVQALVSLISNILRNDITSTKLNGMHFIYMPGYTKQSEDTALWKSTKIYCPQIDKYFDSQVQAAEYFVDNHIWDKIKLKTAKLRISNVVNGDFLDYRGYTFIKV